MADLSKGVNLNNTLAAQVKPTDEQLLDELYGTTSKPTMTDAGVKKYIGPMPKKEPGIVDTAKDIGKGIIRGPFENLKNTTVNLSKYLGIEGTPQELAPFSTDVLEMIGKPSTDAGKIAETISQVGTAVLTTRNIPGATTFTGSMATGAISDFVIWDSNDGRLADLLSEAGVQNELVKYLKHDPKDTAMEDNFKNVVEGALSNVVAEGVIRTTIAGYKAAKASLWASRTPEEVAVAIDGVAVKPIVPKAKKGISPERQIKINEWHKSSAPDTKNIDGTPKVYYHGTNASFDTFSTDKLGAITGAESAKKAFFFTNRPKTADYYAVGDAGSPTTAMNAKKFKGLETLQKYNMNVMPVYINMKNPYIYDFKGKVYRDTTYADIIDKAKAEGYDGVILKNTYDAGELNKVDAIMKGRFKSEDIIAVFKPEQVKSIFNKGTFDEANPSIIDRPDAKIKSDGSVEATIGVSAKQQDSTTMATKTPGVDFTGMKPPQTAFNYDKMPLSMTTMQDFERRASNKEYEELFQTGVVPLRVIEERGTKLYENIKADNGSFTELARAYNTRTQDLPYVQVALKKYLSEADTKISSLRDITAPTDLANIINYKLIKAEMEEVAGNLNAGITSTARTTTSGRIGIDMGIVRKKFEEASFFEPDKLNKDLENFIDKETALLWHKDLNKFADIEEEVVLKKITDSLDPKDSSIKKILNVLVEERTAGFLSNPVSHFINATGNLLSMPIRTAEYYMAGAVGAFTKSEDRFLLDELNAMHSGVFANTKGTFTAMGNALKVIGDGPKIMEDVFEQGLIDSFKKADTGSYRAISQDYLMGDLTNATAIRQLGGQMLDTIGATIRLPYHALTAVDDMFKRSIYGGQISYIATREANKLGLKGEAKSKFIGEFVAAHQSLFMTPNKELSPEIKELIDKHIRKNDGRFHLEAIERAREGTFSEEIRGGVNDSDINRALHFINRARLSFPAAQLIVPFYNTIVNILKFVGRRTPGINMLSQRITSDMAAGGRRRALAQAQMFMGTSLYALGGYLAYNGMVTGAAPKNEREAWKTAGIPEYSIRIGDKWIQYNRFDPIASFLSLTADFTRFHTEMVRRGYADVEGYLDHADEVVYTMTVAFTNNVLNKSMIKGVSDLLKAINDGDATYFESMVASFAPYSGLSNWANQQEYTKEAKGLLEKFIKVYAPYNLRDSLDVLGKPILDEKFFGIKERELTKSPIRKEIMRLQLNVGKFDNKLIANSTQIELEPEDHWKMQQLLESKFKLESKLNALVATPEYKQAPDGIDFSVEGTKKWRIKKMITDGREQARQAFVRNNPAVMKQYTDKVKDNRATLNNRRKGLYEDWLTPTSDAQQQQLLDVGKIK